MINVNEMSGKEIAKLSIFLIFGLPALIGLLIWTIKVTSNPTDISNINKEVELMAESEIPWWLGIFEWLGKIGGTIGAFLIIAFVGFLIWVGEIKPRRY